MQRSYDFQVVAHAFFNVSVYSHSWNEYVIRDLKEPFLLLQMRRSRLREGI